ncbi:hypothetical protein [Streptomyces sp. NPDC026589]|uniref:hypothetical protein n=1 Tax=Streptomyces sp. NPDC026589 TaxID=3155609 RepID=UPI0033E81B32
MRHTPQQQARRAALVDAASGGHSVARIARVRVVLYDRQPARGGSLALPAHRVFAEARDWTVVAAVADTAPLETLARACPLWPRVAELIESGQAGGVVTSSWAIDDGDLLAWLRERHAFVACIDGAPAGVDARASQIAL